jgi:hypothetical protein
MLNLLVKRVAHRRRFPLSCHFQSPSSFFSKRRECQHACLTPTLPTSLPATVTDPFQIFLIIYEFTFSGNLVLAISCSEISPVARLPGRPPNEDDNHHHLVPPEISAKQASRLTLCAQIMIWTVARHVITTEDFAPRHLER